MRVSREIAQAIQHWHVIRLIAIVWAVLLAFWMSISALTTRVVLDLVSGPRGLDQFASGYELVLVGIILSFLGFSLTLGFTLTIVVRSRLKKLARCVDRIALLEQSDTHAAETFAEVRLLGNTIGNLFIRAHDALILQRTLNAINRRINSSMDLEIILPEIIKSAVQLLGGTSGSVTLRDNRGTCQNIAMFNLPRQILSTRVPKWMGLSIETIERGEPVMVEDYSSYERRAPILDSYGFKATLGVPLVNEGQTLGSLVVTTADPSRRFTDADVGLMSIFADQASIAIKNATLYSENLRQMNELRKTKKELAKRASQVRNLLSRTFHSDDESRRRIAAELHDGIVQLVVGALCQIQSVKPLATSETVDTALIESRLARGQDLLRQTIDEMYRVIHDLRPAFLDELGLSRSLKRCVKNFQEAASIDCHMEIVGAEYRIAPDKLLAIFRIVQEALNNVRKHSQASRVDLYLHFNQASILVTVQDNGRGFDLASGTRQGGEHLGITSMEERAYSVGGHLQISSAPNRGTSVSLELPVAVPQGANYCGNTNAEHGDMGAVDSCSDRPFAGDEVSVAGDPA